MLPWQFQTGPLERQTQGGPAAPRREPFDAQTLIVAEELARDIVQTVYVRRVQKVGGELQNVEFDQVPDFKDPGKP